MAAGAYAGDHHLTGAGGSARPTPAAAALALATLGLALTLVWQAASLLRLNLAFTAAETELSFWGRGEYQPPDAARHQVSQALDMLLAAAPDHPDYLALAAYHDTWLAYREDDPTRARPCALRAVDSQYAAQQSRPAYRQGWLTMLGYASRAGGPENMRELAQQRVDSLRAQ